MDNTKIVKFWRGTRQAYNNLSSRNYWTRYIVTETDGTRKRVFWEYSDFP